MYFLSSALMALNWQRTSMMIAKGTQQATAQQIPTRLTTMMAWTTVLTKYVANVRNVNKSIAAVQIFRSMKGILGSLRGSPFLAASARHSRTVSRNRAISASSSSSSSLRARSLWSRRARLGKRVPATTATNEIMRFVCVTWMCTFVSHLC